jgi:Zn-dependent protease
MDPERLRIALLAFPVLLFSLVLHEFGHAYTAHLAGDSTPASQGRLTLNPIAHIDPFGTIIIPIIQFFTSFPLIGWAKPVQVNPLRFRSSEWDIFVTLAGPAMNLVLVVISALVLKVLFMTGLLQHSVLEPVGNILLLFAEINAMLMLFNLIPIPPLDGSRVVHHLLARARSPLAQPYAAIEPYGVFILMALIAIPATARIFGWVHATMLTVILRFVF